MSTPLLPLADEMICRLIRLALLALTSGTHHLPDGLSTSTEADTARRAIADAHDGLLGSADLATISDKLVAGLAPLVAIGFDPTRLYTLATIARIEGKPSIARPVDLAGNVTRLPLVATAATPVVGVGNRGPEKNATASVSDCKILATKGKRVFFTLALERLEHLAYCLPDDGPDGPVRQLRDWVHEAEIFGAHVELGVVAMSSLTRPPSVARRVEDEADLWLRFDVVCCALANVGLGTLELTQLLRGKLLPRSVAHRLRASRDGKGKSDEGSAR